MNTPDVKKSTAGQPSEPHVGVGEPVLRIRDLSIEFTTDHGWVRVVDNLSFQLNRREALGIVGESGSGKSVTALAVMGLLPPAARIVSGRVEFDGVELTKLARREMNRIRGNRLAMVFQEPLTSLNPAYTIGEQVAETLRRHRDYSRQLAWKEAIRLLDRVGIPAAEKRATDYPHAFSGGMRQRAMIAAAIACGPEILIADEPTTALDMTVQALVLDLLSDLCDEFDMGLILISHDLGIIAETCDRTVVMYSAQLVEESPVFDLFRRPQHPYTEGLLRSIPSVGSKDGRLWSIPGVVPSPWEMPDGCRFHPRCEYAEIDRCGTSSIPLYRDGVRSHRCVRADELKLEGTDE